MPRLPRLSRSLLVSSAIILGAGSACSREPAPSFGSIVEAESLGATYLDANELPKAEAAFKRLVSLAPRDAGAHTKLGIVYVRMQRPRDAERELQKAAELDTASVDAQILLAQLMRTNGQADAARQTLTRLTARQPVDPKVYYALAELARTDADSVAGRTSERDALARLVATDPGSTPARLELARVLAATGSTDSALGQLEAIEQLPPTPPRDARPALDSAKRALRAGNARAATLALSTLQRFLELTVPFQSSLEALRAPQIAIAGHPQLTLPTTQSMRERLARDGHNEPVTFSDATARFPSLGDSGAGAYALAVGDYDGDGADDFFVSAGASSAAYLIHWQSGQWVDASSAAGIAVRGATAACFADFDGDGRVDLFVVDAGDRGHLYINGGDGHFRDAAQSARVATPGAATRAVAVDLDHDGDMDLVLSGPSGVRFFRNDGDGTFSDATAAAGLGASSPRTEVAFGDVDDDGLIDLAAIGPSSTSIYANDRQRVLADRAGVAGVASVHGEAIAIADYDNDGYLDLFAGGVLYQNAHGGRFVKDGRAAAALRALDGLDVHDARFVDYDNDGRLDLLVAGTTARGSGLRLLHNDGGGRFSDRSRVLPPVGDTWRIAASDIDRDRDLDLLLVGPGGLRVLRNDGGSANLALEVALTGLTTGSGKNNVLGIGSTLEARVGDLYQRRTVTDRVTLIGLGHHLKADVVRVAWPNGVPQTLYYPGTDQDVVENQVLKSSCGFLYAWNGSRFEFVTDVMWRSALGMPVGIGGNGSASYAPAAASKEYLKIPRGALVARNGHYRLQLTEELWETSYTDEVALVAVDHPDSVDAVVDERFVPPGPPVSLDLQATRRVRPVVSAVDDQGTDLLPALRDADFTYASSFALGRFQGVTAPHSMILDLGADLGAGRTLLLLRGWVFPTDASINVSLSQGHAAPVAWPVLDVRDASGTWRPAVTDLSIPSGKNKLVVVDLTGNFPTNDHHVRIRTNAQVYWDQASVATTAPASPRVVTRLRPTAADVHYRGFSRMYRKGGRYGPHWFDYALSSTASPWQPIAGRFTRYGDVDSLLLASDDEYIVMAPGDETTIDFDAAGAPPLAPGWTRDFFLYSDGWIKDADLNTAHGGTAEPLPFHAMTRYPYEPGERYPSDAAHARYLARYETRRLDGRPLPLDANVKR
jgi:Flp pilus assembly protein TadD